MTTTIITLREFKLLSLCILLAICGSLGLDIHLASLPHIMVYMHTNKEHMQQSVSLFILGVGLSILVYGPLSDKVGRKPVVIFGLALACITSYLAAWTHHITPFLTMRFIQGLGSGVCWGLGRVIAADIMQGERLSAIGSYFTLFLSLSPLLAPALGGYMQHWFNWQANFILLGSTVLFVLFIFILLYEETNLHKRANAFALIPLTKTYFSFFSKRIFVGCTLLTGIAMSANMTYTTVSAFIFQQQFHTSPIMFGWLTAIVGVAGIVSKLICPFFIFRLKNYKSLIMGITVLLISGIILSFFVITHLISIPTVLIGVSIAIFAQVFLANISMSMALSPFHDKRGAAGALYSASQLTIAFIVSSTMAGLPHLGTSLLAGTYVILGILGFSSYYVFVKPIK